AIPAGNSVAAHFLIRLSLLTGEERYRRLAEQVLKLMKSSITRAPSAFGHLLCALDLYLASPYEIALIGAQGSNDTRELINTVFSQYLPNKVVALLEPGQNAKIKLLEGRSAIGGKATAYVCRNFYCEAPVTDAAKLNDQLLS